VAVIEAGAGVVARACTEAEENIVELRGRGGERRGEERRGEERRRRKGKERGRREGKEWSWRSIIEVKAWKRKAYGK